jgi:hypothetical protein
VVGWWFSPVTPTRLTAVSDKAYQLLAHGRWFSLGIPVSSTTKTGRQDIAERLLKVALNTINKKKSHIKLTVVSSNPVHGGVLDTTLCNQVCQCLVVGWWFSPVTPVSSTNKTDCHDITNILLKVN